MTAVLPGAGEVHARAAGENFPVALRGLPGRVRWKLRAVYGYARLVDTVGDELAGDRLAVLDDLEREVRAVHAGRSDGAGHPVLADLARLCRAADVPLQPLVDLVEANRLDQRVRRYPSFAELLGYCRLSADPVGRLVLHVLGVATPDRVALSDRVCTALQLVEHWQDVAEDAQRGRVYLPAEDLDRFGVGVADLVPGPTPEPVRRLLAFEVARASGLLDAGAPLVGTLRGAARVAVAGFVGGGRATVASLRRARFDVLHRPVRAGRGARARHALHTWAAGQ